MPRQHSALRAVLMHPVRDARFIQPIQFSGYVQSLYKLLFSVPACDPRAASWASLHQYFFEYF